jgi:hypothetical protein
VRLHLAGVHREQFGGKQRLVVRIQMRDCRFYFLQGAHSITGSNHSGRDAHAQADI